MKRTFQINTFREHLEMAFSRTRWCYAIHTTAYTILLSRFYYPNVYHSGCNDICKKIRSLKYQLQNNKVKAKKDKSESENKVKGIY